jgi:hypothetical protein
VPHVRALEFDLGAVRQLRAAHSRAGTKKSRCEMSPARTISENLSAATARTANHLVLIRSFFARFRSAHTICAAILKIIFACADVGAACDVDAKLNGHARKFFVERR